MGSVEFELEISAVLDLSGWGDETEMVVYVKGTVNPLTPATYHSPSEGGDVEDVTAYIEIFDQKVELCQGWIDDHDDVITVLACEQME